MANWSKKNTGKPVITDLGNIQLITDRIDNLENGMNGDETLSSVDIGGTSKISGSGVSVDVGSLKVLGSEITSPTPWSYLGTGTLGDVSITSNATISGEYEYNNLTLSGTTTLTLRKSGYTIIRVKGTLEINGTIVINGNSKAPLSYASSYIAATGNGQGNGASTINISETYFTSRYPIISCGGKGGDGGSGSGAYGGTGRAGGTGWKTSGMSFGYGIKTSDDNPSPTAYEINYIKKFSSVAFGGLGGVGGGGGGGGFSSSSIFGNGGSSLFGSGGPKDSGATSRRDASAGYAGGGGGGCCGTTPNNGPTDGSGTIGSGGGCVIFVCNILKITSGTLTINCNGGNGGAGGNGAGGADCGCGGGGGGAGGGGGGLIIFGYETVSSGNISSVTCTATGGSGGSGGSGGVASGGPASGGAGGAGASGSAGWWEKTVLSTNSGTHI